MDHHPDYQTSDIDRRLSKLEAVVESLASNVGRITNDIGQLAHHLQQRSQTNWSTVFAGITLVVLLVTGYVGLPLNALQGRFEQHQASQSADQERIWKHHGMLEARIRDIEVGDAATAERIRSIERHIYGPGRGKCRGEHCPGQEDR